MGDRNIWEASKFGDLQRVKRLIEVDKVDINIQNPGVRNYSFSFLIFFLIFDLSLFRMVIQP